MNAAGRLILSCSLLAVALEVRFVAVLEQLEQPVVRALLRGRYRCRLGDYHGRRSDCRRRGQQG